MPARHAECTRSPQVVPASPLAASAPEAFAARVVIELVAVGARDEQVLVLVAVGVEPLRVKHASAQVQATLRADPFEDRLRRVAQQQRMAPGLDQQQVEPSVAVSLGVRLWGGAGA